MKKLEQTRATSSRSRLLSRWEMAKATGGISPKPEPPSSGAISIVDPITLVIAIRL